MATPVGPVEESRSGGDDPESTTEADAMNGEAAAATGVQPAAAVDVLVGSDGRSTVYREEEEFVGLKREDLARYAADPYWVRLRLGLLAVFCVGWLGMLTGAVLIIVLAPKCPPCPPMEWWQSAVVYQVYPRSFQDTNDDGVGDLKGVQKHLEYFKNLSITAVWLNSIYPSANVDFGYDVTDHINVSLAYGTMEDFVNLVSDMHKHGIKLIMDFIPNHTSQNHTWFQESRRDGSGNNLFRDFYIWHPGKILQNGTKAPPNNWLSVHGGSAWTLDNIRGEYYYHQFLEEQPDLNLSNPAVIQHLDNVLKFWLKKGVDGFCIDSAAYLVESSSLNEDEPASGETVSSDDYKSLEHSLTRLQPETFELITHWRELLDNFSESDGRSVSKFYPRLLIAESYATPNESVQFVSYEGRPGAHLATNMVLLQLTHDCRASCIHGLIELWMDQAQASRMWSNWQLGNHDYSRVITRFGDPAYVNALNMLHLMLPGSAFTYYGEEIGMHDVDVLWNEAQDYVGKRRGKELFMNYSRDPQCSPMQWSDERFAGFTNAKSPWLPVAKDYYSINVQAQSAHGFGISSLDVYTELVRMRQAPSLKWGDFYQGLEDNINFIVRQAPGYPGFLAAINFGTKASSVNFVLSSPLAGLIPEFASVVASTGNFKDLTRMKQYANGVNVKLSNVHLKPSEGVVFSW